MRVVYSEQVKRNIIDIVDYTESEWGTSKRIELVKLIADSIDIIAQFPRSAKFDLDLGLHYKLVSKSPFVIVYTVESDLIRIVKIIHTRRNR